MIDLTKLEECPEKINVQPSNNIFLELGKNTYNYVDLISELIDNSIAARQKDTKLIVTIDFYVDTNGKITEIVIKDNASGIPSGRLGIAITPAGLSGSNSLNEHGLGMKQAIAALGILKYLATKTKGEKRARVVQEFRFGEIPAYYADWDSENGTEISIIDPKSIVVSNPTVITRNIVPHLGARYRRFLRPDKKIADIILRLRRTDNDTVTNSWDVEEFKPIYFHPSTRTNKPVITNHQISGEGWKASLTFGYAPDEEECKELGILFPGKHHPYYVSLGKQGLDILRHDRVILLHQLSEIGIVNSRHPDFNNIRGEIDLLEGFSTAITKNSIIDDGNFSECITKITGILVGNAEIDGEKNKNYLRVKTYPEQIPEKLLRDRLACWLSTNPVTPKKDVHTEYVIQGIEGFIDVFADKEAWEIKTEQASAVDVYQLFMYMDVGKIDKGYLVATDFTTGAKVAVKHIVANHKKEISLTELKQLPINHHPDANEREKYY